MTVIPQEVREATQEVLTEEALNLFWDRIHPVLHQIPRELWEAGECNEVLTYIQISQERAKSALARRR